MAPGDYELIQKANNGDVMSFEELVHRYDRNVLSIALKYTKNEDDAKDIYQEVFIRVYKGLKNFKFQSEFSTWLFRITTNVCLTFKSRKRNYQTVPLDSGAEDDDNRGLDETLPGDDSFSADRSVSRKEAAEEINKALEALSPKQRMVFTLKHNEGFKLREIASMLEISEGTAKKYLFESVHKLRTLLAGYYR